MLRTMLAPAERSPQMADYDSTLLGPILAVSDEGSAGSAIIDAAYGSAKAAALPSLDPLTLGVLLDGERMTSAGEVPIGPDEYAALLAVARGRVLCTTNVGVRVNTRLARLLPEFAASGFLGDAGRYEEVFKTFLPFMRTPDNRPRPLTIRLVIGPEEGTHAIRPVDRAQDAFLPGSVRWPVRLSDKVANPVLDGSQLLRQITEVFDRIHASPQVR
jgi:hypothetical protein